MTEARHSILDKKENTTLNKKEQSQVFFSSKRIAKVTYIKSTQFTVKELSVSLFACS